MSYILVDDSQKGNKCCSKSIDLERGCSNQCIGCYGTKTSMMGADNYFNHVVSKDYDEKRFRSSVKSTLRKGYQFARLGKHSDGGHSHLNEVLKSTLKVCNEEGLKLVFVSKSLTYSKEVADLLKAGNHTLHISLGMKTKAQSELDRAKTFVAYKYSGVDVKLRIVGDITKPFTMPLMQSYKKPMYDWYIVTPMRFTSKEILEEYDADPCKYKYINGYYRPQEMHESWNNFTNFCGEVGSEMKCCGCLTGD